MIFKSLVEEGEITEESIAVELNDYLVQWLTT